MVYYKIGSRQKSVVDIGVCFIIYKYDKIYLPLQSYLVFYVNVWYSDTVQLDAMESGFLVRDNELILHLHYH